MVFHKHGLPEPFMLSTYTINPQGLSSLSSYFPQVAPQVLCKMLEKPVSRRGKKAPISIVPVDQERPPPSQNLLAQALPTMTGSLTLAAQRTIAD